MNNREIEIEEMPQGCVLYDKYNVWRDSITISSREDAEAIIESLQRMIKAMPPEENDIPVSPI